VRRRPDAATAPNLHLVDAYAHDAPQPAPKASRQSFRVALINALEADARVTGVLDTPIGRVSAPTVLLVGKALARFVNTKLTFPRCAEVWPAIPTLASDTRRSTKSVRRALYALESLGYFLPRGDWEERRRRGWASRQGCTLHLRIPLITPRPELRLRVFEPIRGGADAVPTTDPVTQTMDTVTETMDTVVETMDPRSHEAPEEAPKEVKGAHEREGALVRAHSYQEWCLSCQQPFWASDEDEAFCPSCAPPAWRN